MAFTPLGWSPDYRPSGSRIHSYSSEDSLNTVLGANYFGSIWGQVRADDKIECVETDTNTAFTVYVTAVSRDTVTVSDTSSIRTIVIPLGESFKIVDDAISPTMIVMFDNEYDTANRRSFLVDWQYGVDNQAQLELSQTSGGFTVQTTTLTNTLGTYTSRLLMDNTTGPEFKVYSASADNSMLSELVISQNLDSNASDFGAGGFTAYIENPNGNNRLTFSTNEAGVGSFSVGGQKIEFPDMPTYADNAAAITGGLTAGQEYYTPAGARYKVV